MSGIKDLAAKGRNGDNMLMHVSSDEVAGLNALAQDMMGRELTTNPDTGLPEAFLFAPLAAPLIAGGMGLGTGAIATGLTAGALGAAEAELRGMDDPLRRGLFSGLTAGAASGLGNALSGAAEAGTGAAGAGAGATGPGMDAAIQGAGTGGGTATGFSVTNPSASALGGSASGTAASTGPLSTLGQGTQAATQSATQAPTASLAGTSAGQIPGSSVTPPASASAQFPSGSNFATTTPSSSTGSMTLDPQQAFQQSQYADAPQMVQGAQNIFRDEAARGQFMQQAKVPLTAGSIGLGGQAQMRAQDEMKSRQEAADAESAAELKEAQDRIRANYAAVGRPMPTGFGGGPLFADGGIVGLRRGGNVGGPGGGSDPGNRGGGSSGGSRGGGGPGRDTPGSPNAPDGRRGASMGPSGGVATGGGGSSAAVQQSPQLDPAKIRAAVISPMDDFGNAVKDIASMTLAGRVLGALTRDRRGTGVEQLGPHGPGAPLSASERGIGRDGAPRASNMGGGDGGGGLPPIPSGPAKTGPTLPLMAERQPTPNESKFLAALQQGAGNQAAMQQTGYGMAEGGIVGLFDGGFLQKVANAFKKQGNSETKTSRSEGGPDFERFLAELRKGKGNQAAMELTGYGMAEGGYLDGGMLPGDGMSDDIPATIDGEQPAALSSNEFVIPADVVSHIGNGSSDAGARELYEMMDRIRKARTGKESQAPEVNMRKMMPK